MVEAGQPVGVLVLSQRDVEQVLDLEQLVAALASAMAEVASGRASMPPRVAARVDERDGLLVAMPAHLPGAAALTTKLVALFPHNVDRPTHQAVIVCFDPADGTTLAVMDGTFITEARTAAGSLLASRHLARRDASRVTIIGAGAQARAHARAFATWPGLESITLTARNPERLQRLVAELARDGPTGACRNVAARVPRGSGHRVRDHPRLAAGRAPGVGEAGHARQLGRLQHRRRWGGRRGSGARCRTSSSSPARQPSRPPPAGAIELHRAIEAGIADPIDAELGSLVLGTSVGRQDDDTVTLYKSVGVAAQDAAAASLVLAEAARRSVGQRVDL